VLAKLLPTGNVLVDTGTGILELDPAHPSYLTARQRLSKPGLARTSRAAHYAANHDVSTEARDNAGKWTEGGATAANGAPEANGAPPKVKKEVTERVKLILADADKAPLSAATTTKLKAAWTATSWPTWNGLWNRRKTRRSIVRWRTFHRTLTTTTLLATAI
jgi:hypothetical protein